MVIETARIVFFVPEWPASNSAVLHSQVLSVAKFLSKNGFCCMFIGCDISDEKANASTKIISEMYGIQTVVLGIYTTKFGYVSMLYTAGKLYRLTRKLIQDFQPTHIYSRSFVDSVYARKIAREQKAISVYDVRGVVAEEAAFKWGRRGIKYKYILYKEMNELRKSDRLTCVSKNLKDYINAKVGRNDAIVIPSCVEMKMFFYDSKARKEIREKYLLNDEQKVVCYSGGLSKWQRINDIIKLFEQIANTDENYRFIFLIEQSEYLHEIIMKTTLPINKCIILWCSHEQVHKYLSAADAGIIMRENTIVNNVASPIKIGEYLACGLPIIMTRGIGDFGDLVSQIGIGLLLEENGDMACQVISFMSRLDYAEVRRKAINFAYKHFSFQSHLEDYKKLYTKNMLKNIGHGKFG